MTFKYKEIYDISVPISADGPIYPGDPEIEINTIYSTLKGDSANILELKFGSHVGTHIDAPYHFLQNGKTLDKIELNKFLGRAQVCELNVVESIKKADLIPFEINKGDIILFKTKNSSLWNKKEFQREFIYLTPEAAEYLVAQRIKGVGIDYLSIEKYKSREHSTHQTLLRNNILILEGINLTDVPAGEYFLICFPLKLIGADGSPVRAILLK
jgi:arylformamidase